VQEVIAEPWAPPQFLHTDLDLIDTVGDISEWLKQPKLPIGLLWSGMDWELQVLDGPPSFARWRAEMDNKTKTRVVPTVSLTLDANQAVAFRCANSFCTL
jgi:hypothetical protein